MKECIAHASETYAYRALGQNVILPSAINR